MTLTGRNSATSPGGTQPETPAGVQPVGSVSLPRATVFFCHGSRNPDWRTPFELLLEDHRRRFPGQTVRLAFLELMTPTLVQVLGELAGDGATMVRVVPLFLSPGAHTRRDLPALVAQAQAQWPALHVEVAPTLLESEALRTAVVEALYVND